MLSEKIKRLISVVSISVLFIFAMNAYAETIDKIVAFVNDDIITQGELDRSLFMMQQELRANHAAAPKPEVMRKMVLNVLVLEHLQLALAKKNNLSATEKDIDEAIQNLAARNHLTVTNFKKSLAAANLDYTDYRRNLAKQVIIRRLQQRAVAPDVHLSESMVDKFIEQYRSTHRGRAVEYHIWDLVVPLPDNPNQVKLRAAEREAQKLAEQLKTGRRTAAQLASRLQKKYPDLPGGDMGWRSITDLPSLFVAPVKTLAINGVAKPMRAGNGYHIIQLLEKRDPALMLSRKTARALAYQEAFRKKLKAWLDQLKTSAYIKFT